MRMPCWTEENFVSIAESTQLVKGEKAEGRESRIHSARKLFTCTHRGYFPAPLFYVMSYHITQP